MRLYTKEHTADFGKGRQGGRVLGDRVATDRENLICIASRPGMGKTALALHMAMEYARRCDRTVLIFSPDMSAEQMYRRMACCLAEVDSYSIRTGELSGGERERLANAAQMLRRWNMVIDDDMSLSVNELARRASETPNVGMVVLDGFELLQENAPGRAEGREQSAQVLWRLAMRLEIPVVVTVQLRRDVDGRKNKRPLLADLRKVSDVLATMSGTVIFPYREEYYAQACVGQGKAPMEINVAKNGDGETGVVTCGWCDRYAKLTSEMPQKG